MATRPRGRLDLQEYTQARGADLCTHDKDYRTNQEIAEFIDAMRGEGIKCHVFRRKEIENYVLSVDVIQRRC